MPDLALQRRLPIGAELADPHNAHVRVWAPRANRVTVVTNGARAALARDDAGYYSGRVAARAGDLYQFQIDDDEKLYPDPASRFQPDGPHGPSEIIDPAQFRWTDGEWTGVSRERQVVYEMHIGTFTPAGTWAAAMIDLPCLRSVPFCSR